MALISYGDTGFEFKIYVLEFHFNEATLASRAPNEPSSQVGSREEQARGGSLHLPTMYCLLEWLDLFTRYFTSTHKTFTYKLHEDGNSTSYKIWNNCFQGQTTSIALPLHH